VDVLKLQLISSIFAILTALTVTFLIDPWKRWFRRTNLIPIDVISYFQDFQYIYRLQLRNESCYTAKNVEIDVEGVRDNGDKLRENFVPSPLSWTHRTTEPRNILPHQNAFLDICEVKQEANKFIILAAPHIKPLKEMPYIKKGTTRLVLKYYQENGQTGEVKLKITWNGNETFNEGDLPTVVIEKD